MFGLLRSARGRIHDYTDAHRVKLEIEKEHVVLIVGYVGYSITHMTVLVIIAYVCAATSHGAGMVKVEQK